MHKVLVVDDVPDNVELLACALEDQGYEVLKAYDGIDALKVAGTSKPDVIMLDVMMPGIDGIEVCRRLKKDPKLQSIPVIMVSALEQDIDLMKGLEAGAQDYIVKPYNVLVAMARVQIALARVRSAALWKETADSLRDREQRFQAVFNQTFQFMGLLDTQGVVLEVNRAALECINTGRESVVGRTFWELPWWAGSPQAQERLEAGVAEAAAGQIVNFEAEHPGKDGETANVDFAIMPVTEESGRVVLLLAVGHDVTDRKRAEAEMLASKEAAEAASQAKGEFLANVSHEIRTPMNAILGMTALTLDSDLNPEQRANLEIVKSATDSLLAVINDLLDFSKMEAGKLELDPVEFGLRKHIADILDLLGRRAFAKGLELAYRVDPEVPDQLIGDPTRLRQIVVNLVGNAIKFTERGEVVIDVDAETWAEGNVDLHFRVTDTGIGIPADQQQAIFAAFTQADGSTTRLYGGTGLGLTISSQLAGLMGGRVWIESQVGRGSTFHFTAHFALSSAAGPAHDPSLASLRGMRVLVVDDNAVNRRLVAEILAYWGMKPTLADGGQAALTLLKKAHDAGTPFSLVLIDAMMPGMDGFTLAERINADPELTRIILLMLTSADRQEFTDRYKRAGITACLSKPIHQFELKATILAAVGLTQPADEEPSPVEPPAPRPLARALLILVAEDNPFNQRVASLMLAKIGHVAKIAVNGHEALAALRHQPFDVVLMDLQMPIMDGFQATAAIRASEAGSGRHVPIVALTAHAMKEDRIRCLEAGMDGYVSKPIEEDKLRQAIEDCFFLIGEVPDAESPDRASASPIDVAAALARVDGDRKFLGEMAVMFLEESPRLLARIREAVAAGDSAGLVAPAHTLKNWTGNFVASAAFGAVTDLEAMGRAQTLATAGAALAALERETERLARAIAQFNPEPAPVNGEESCSASASDPRGSLCTH